MKWGPERGVIVVGWGGSRLHKVIMIEQAGV